MSDLILEPLTAGEIEKIRNEDGYISARVIIELHDIIDNDLEGFLDILSEKLVGDDLLMDIDYKVTGVANENEVVIEVSGDPSASLEVNKSGD